MYTHSGFNVAEHAIHDAVFSGPMYDLLGAEYEGPGSFDSVQDAMRAVAAPTIGGVVVTGLRVLAGGFAGDPPSVKPSKKKGKHNDGDSESRIRTTAKPALKAVAAAVTLGSGASLGPEGPSVEIGANVAKGVAAISVVI